VAVDTAGNVYIGHGFHVNKYTPTGNSQTPGGLDAVSTLNTEPVRNCLVAVDAEGDLYSEEFFNGGVTKYLPSEFGLERAVGNMVPLAESPIGVVEYRATGNRYRGASRVVIESVALVPDVGTDAAFNLSKFGGTLTGAVNPDGMAVTGCEFEYGSEEGVFTSAVPCSQTVPFIGVKSLPVSASVTGLQPGTTYFYRLAATNGNGTNQSDAGTFTTAQAVDDVRTSSASDIARATATLNGSLAPDGVDTVYYFEYGAEAGTYGSISPVLPGVDVGTASESVAAEAPIAGLEVNTTYHFRLVAASGLGVTYGSDMSFVTLPAVDKVATGVASAVSATTVRLNGSLAPNGVDAMYYFEYGVDAGAYEAMIPVPPGVDAGTASEDVASVATISGLTPNAGYHFRLVATNAFGVTYGEDRSFRTSLALPVNSEPLSILEAGRSSALISGAVIDPEHAPTTYHLAYIDEAGYEAAILAASTDSEVAANPYASGDRTISLDAGSGYGRQVLAPIRLRGLLSNTTYHYALVATSPAGTAIGPDGTLTTALGTPPVLATGTATVVSPNEANVYATVDTRGLATSYGFEVSTSTDYGPPTGLGSVSPGTGPTTVMLQLTGLQPGTTYHFRIEAMNVDGAAVGVDREFTTPVFPGQFVVMPMSLPFILPPAIAFPVEQPAVRVPVRTRAQKLVAALKACKKVPAKKRAACVKRARKSYGPLKKKAK